MRQLGPNDPNSKQAQSGFIFHYDDNTIQEIGLVNSNNLSYYSALEAGLLGLKCSFHQKPHGQTNNFDPNYGCIPYSIACASLSFDPKTITNMSLLLGTTATQNVAHTFGGWISECGPIFYSLTPAQSFLTIANGILTANPTLPAHTNTYAMSLNVSL